jgi:hypothetical protein
MRTFCEFHDISCKNRQKAAAEILRQQKTGGAKPHRRL